MGRGQAVIVAGIGCRKDCPAGPIVALVQAAGTVDVLAAPDWKRDEPGLLAAAAALRLPLRFVAQAAMASVQALCPTRSAIASRAVGLASVAEAAALAGGGTLLRPRFGAGQATCALATEPSSPPPLAGGARGGVRQPKAAASADYGRTPPTRVGETPP